LRKSYPFPPFHRGDIVSFYLSDFGFPVLPPTSCAPCVIFLYREYRPFPPFKGKEFISSSCLCRCKSLPFPFALLRFFFFCMTPVDPLFCALKLAWLTRCVEFFFFFSFVIPLFCSQAPCPKTHSTFVPLDSSRGFFFCNGL